MLEHGGSTADSSPAICADGIIYIGVTIGDWDGGEILAINSDGTERWRQRLSNYRGRSSPAIGSDGTIYISSVSEDPHVSCLHAFGPLDPNAPEAPSITGEINGEVGVEYEYTFSSMDPNNDDVYYNIDWGDIWLQDWFGPYESGEEVVFSHTWVNEDDYTCRAKARDTDNLLGPWGELEVTMPVNQPDQFSILQWILECFPNAFLILRQLLEI